MTNSYSNLNASVDQNYAMYQNQYNNRTSSGSNSILPRALGSATIGFIGGTGIAATVDYLKNNEQVKDISDKVVEGYNKAKAGVEDYLNKPEVKEREQNTALADNSSQLDKAAQKESDKQLQEAQQKLQQHIKP